MPSISKASQDNRDKRSDKNHKFKWQQYFKRTMKFVLFRIIFVFVVDFWKKVVVYQQLILALLGQVEHSLSPFLPISTLNCDVFIKVKLCARPSPATSPPFLLPSNCLFASFSSLGLMYVPPMSSSTSTLPLPLGDANAVVRLELKAANRVALCCGALGWC